MREVSDYIEREKRCGATSIVLELPNHLRDLNADELLSLAQFLKRVGWSECRRLAVDNREAERMVTGLDKVRRLLVEHGINPR